MLRRDTNPTREKLKRIIHKSNERSAKVLLFFYADKNITLMSGKRV